VILGMPVVDNHELTAKVVESLKKTVRGLFKLVIIDQASDVPYSAHEFGDADFDIFVERYEDNRGFYWPLFNLQKEFRKVALDGLIGLAHNDVIFYEVGWDVRMVDAFRNDPKLGLVGLCGSNQVDAAGGRGSGTMCFFRGTPGKGQSQAAGLRINDLRPALVLDSQFMMFRKEAIVLCESDQDPPPAHFYDKIWPMRLAMNGFHVAVLGSEIDHMGGMTCVLNRKYLKACEDWCRRQGIQPGHMSTQDGQQIRWDDWAMGVYRAAEVAMFREFGQQTTGFIPNEVDGAYKLLR
jgi:hypothetical protein